MQEKFTGEQQETTVRQESSNLTENLIIEKKTNFMNSLRSFLAISFLIGLVGCAHKTEDKDSDNSIMTQENSLSAENFLEQKGVRNFSEETERAISAISLLNYKDEDFDFNAELKAIEDSLDSNQEKQRKFGELYDRKQDWYINKVKQVEQNLESQRLTEAAELRKQVLKKAETDVFLKERLTLMEESGYDISKQSGALQITSYSYMLGNQ